MDVKETVAKLSKILQEHNLKKIKSKGHLKEELPPLMTRTVLHFVLLSGFIEDKETGFPEDWAKP